MPCDPFELTLIQRGFRRALHGAAVLVRDAGAGDRRRVEVVARHVEFIAMALQGHCRAADHQIVSRLSVRLPCPDARLDRMTDAHRAIDDACVRVGSAARLWRADPAPARAGELASRIEGLVRLADRHFDDEGHAVVPLIAEHLDSNEWRRFLAQGSAVVWRDLRRGLAMGAMMLHGVSPRTRERFLADLPAPARLVFRAFGDRVYVRYRVKVYGPR